MAIDALTPQVASPAGIVPTYQSLTTGNTYTVPDSLRPVLLHFKNVGGSAVTVTFSDPKVPGEHEAETHTASVAATTGETIVGPFNPEDYGDKLAFTVSAAATCAVIQLPLTQRAG